MTQIGFCIISQWPLTGFLSNYKKVPYDSYSIYIAICSLIFQAVYPVGVTDLRPYFTQIIGNNSVNVHRIPTNLVLRFAVMSPVRVPYFSSIRARIRVLRRILQSVRKEAEEKRRKNPNFDRS